VRDGEAGDVDIADGEARAGLKQLQVRRMVGDWIPGNGRRGEARNVDGNTQLAGDDLQTVNMIGMLMGDENCGERFGGAAGGVETLEGFLAGEAGVDQETGPLSRDQRGIAGA
jgi:hypothetical protein